MLGDNSDPCPPSSVSRPPSPDETPLTGTALVKEVCRLIRLARSRWDAHDNGGCRRERNRAMHLYNTLTEEQKDEIPQALRVWLRYRSECYFGAAKKKKPRKKPARAAPG